MGEAYGVNDSNLFVRPDGTELDGCATLAELNALAAEVARLREKLRMLADNADDTARGVIPHLPPPHHAVTMLQLLQDSADAIRAALAEGGGPHA